jgi:predicted NACHT family NTPase
MGVEIGFDGYLESVVANCHESLRLYTLMDDCEQSQPDFFELKMQVVQPQPENKKRSEQETDKDKNAEPLPENKKRSEQEADKDKNAKPPIPVLEIYKYAQDHVLLMGKAGSGKSTALQKLLLNKAQEAQRNSEALIPVLVKLRSWQSFPSVVALIQDVLETGIQRRLDEETIIDLLFSGRLLLLIDGVNELPSYFQDRNPSHDVEAFRKKYRKTSMIFTTRVLGVSRNLGIAKQMEMLPLSDREMRQFIERCLPQQSEQMLNRLGDRLSRLGETPLLLSMLCDISRQREDGLPANLGSPFKAFADSYDRKIQGDIPVDDKYKRWLPDLLPQIAFAMMPQNDPDGLRLEIPKFEAEDILAKFLDAEKFDKPRDHAKQWLENLLKYHLIQIKTDQIIEFRHQLIQEYYAAEYLRMRLECLTDEKLQKSYLNYLDWTESLTLMLDCEDREEQAVRLVRLALAVDLRLVARLAGAVKYEFQEKTIGLLLREIEEQKTPKLYAIELLGEARSDIAIKSLIQSLTDSDYYVYRFAVVALGKIGSDKAVEPLIQILYNQDYYGLGEVVEVLGGIGSDKAVESLIQILNDPLRFADF